MGASGQAVFTVTVQGCGSSAANANASTALRNKLEIAARDACTTTELSQFCSVYLPKSLCALDGFGGYDDPPCAPSARILPLQDGTGCTIAADAWCIKNIPPKPPGTKEVTLDVIYNQSLADTSRNFTDQFCKGESSKDACTAAFLFAEDKGVGPSAWQT